ncbi:hypothetical protein BCR44DRAFT_1216537 [Catenaria anguillulae PL171]|uniref:Uncharacterized protein n=1 Tax=Catenaria anguillulae PL171 TaxID=765915 RepID=A0A1Y2I1L0_9FUNG|nr:hypothetical protein BCR44DRAFT_1216537 [Catenaria anguillulae PL171]
MAFDPNVPEGKVNDSTKRLSFFLTFLETSQLIAFTLLNYFRLYRLCHTSRVTLLRILGGLVAVTVVFNIVCNSGIVYYLAQNYQYYYIPLWNQVYGCALTALDFLRPMGSVLTCY